MLANFKPLGKVIWMGAALLALATTEDPSSAELAARRARIASMDAATQQDLLRKFERFSALPADEQTRLRELQAAIMSDPNSERLMIVLERYHEWLKTISTTQRAKLAELSPKDRVREIESIRRAQRDAQRLETLTRDDMRDIRRWVDDMVGRHRQQLVDSISDKYRDWYNRQTDPQMKEMALVYRMFGRAQDGSDESVVTQQDIDRLTKRLSDTARAELAKATTPEEQRRIVRGWIFASLRRSVAWQHGRRNNPVVGEELLQFLQTEVPPAERERLLQKPREEMLLELRKMYFERSGRPRRGSFDGHPDRHRPDYHRGRQDGPPPGGPQPRRPQESPVEQPAPADAAPQPAPAE